MAFFTIDDVAFENIRVVSCQQTFEILDGEGATRTLDGIMHRDIIGTYYNYNLKLSPKMTEAGMREYNKLWNMVSNPQEKHTLVVPYDVGDSVVHDTQTYQAYITSGKREMKKYNYNGVDYWGEGEFNFISVSPKKRP